MAEWFCHVLFFTCFCLLTAANVHKEERVKRQSSGKPLAGFDMRIVTIVQHPYTFTDDEGSTFYGFIPDVIDRLQEELGFNYTFTLSPDGRYGRMDQDGNWNGMIGELIKNERDATKGFHMAAAPITITRSRERVVDFLNPFHHVGISAMIQKPDRRSDAVTAPWHFNFNVIKPLSPACWVLIFVVMTVVWIFFFVMNRFNPYEFGERYRRNMASEDQSELFTIAGSIWFTFTTLNWQGYDRAPRSIASKMMGCFWMVFVTLTLVTYISSFLNYMFWASMTHRLDPTVPPISDVIDLVNHKDGYTYGALKDSSTMKYFENQPSPEYNKMEYYWSSTEGQKQLVQNTEEALQKVRSGKYAWFGETMPIRYMVSQADNCDLMDLGWNMGTRSYGLAVPENMEHEETLRKAVLGMIESGTIDSLEAKWFDQGECHKLKIAEKVAAKDNTFSINKPQPVNISMFWSPLLIILIGIILSALAAVAEIIYYKKRGQYNVNNRVPGKQLTNDEDPHI